MDRVLTIILFILIVNPLNGQVEDIAVGVTYQPFIYKNYNESDWNNRPQSYPVKPAHFNGFAIGAIAEKSLSEHYSLKGELTYSEQTQKHRSTNFNPDNIEIELPYNINISTSFNLLKLPISLAISTELGYNSNLYIQAFIGGQISLLTHYNSRYTTYQVKYDSTMPDPALEINWDILVNEIIRTPNNSEQRFCTCLFGGQVEYSEDKWSTDYIYNRLLLGVVGGFELRRIIFEDYVIGIGGRFEYDISNTDNTASDFQPHIARRTIYDPSTRAKSHNIRMGVSLSFVYLIH